MKRIDQEKTTVAKMIAMYCKARHASSKGCLCRECAELVKYSHARLDRCPNWSHKSSCRKCSTHCYAPRQREQMRIAMRYAGPRMIWRHPIDAIIHLYREFLS